jgi:hypothetical protein
MEWTNEANSTDEIMNLCTVEMPFNHMSPRLEQAMVRASHRLPDEAMTNSL